MFFVSFKVFSSHYVVLYIIVKEAVSGYMERFLHLHSFNVKYASFVQYSL